MFISVIYISSHIFFDDFEMLKWSYSIFKDIINCNNDSGCHENATCTDANGSYTCDCNPGFTGDGFNCTGKTFTSWAVRYFSEGNQFLFNCLLIQGLIESLGKLLWVLTRVHIKIQFNKSANSCLSWLPSMSFLIWPMWI